MRFYRPYIVCMGFDLRIFVSPTWVRIVIINQITEYSELNINPLVQKFKWLHAKPCSTVRWKIKNTLKRKIGALVREEKSLDNLYLYFWNGSIWTFLHSNGEQLIFIKIIRPKIKTMTPKYNIKQELQSRNY